MQFIIHKRKHNNKNRAAIENTGISKGNKKVPDLQNFQL